MAKPRQEQIAAAKPHPLAGSLHGATQNMNAGASSEAEPAPSPSPSPADQKQVDIWSLSPDAAPEPAKVEPPKPDKTLAHGQSRGWWLERYRVGDQMGLQPHAQDALLRDRELTSRNYDEGQRFKDLMKGCESAESQNRGRLMYNVEVQRRAELLSPRGPVREDFRHMRQDSFRALRDHDEAHGNRIGQNADISREMSPRQQLNNDVARSNRTWPDQEQHTEFNKAVARVRQHPELAQPGRTALAEDHRARTADIGPRRQDIPADSTEVTLAPRPHAASAPKPAESDLLKIKP